MTTRKRGARVRPVPALRGNQNAKGHGRPRKPDQEKLPRSQLAFTATPELCLAAKRIAAMLDYPHYGDYLRALLSTDVRRHVLAAGCVRCGQPTDPATALIVNGAAVCAACQTPADFVR